MKMLREWNGNSNELIFKALEKFGVKPGGFTLHKYEAITPDSFLWIFNIDDDRYCLYAEDYIVEVGEVLAQIKEHKWSWNPEEEYELVPAVSPLVWNKYSPNESPDDDTPMKVSEEYMKCATQSGYDMVFLAKVVNRKMAKGFI